MNKMIGIILMISGIILFVSGLIFYNTPNKTRKQPIAQAIDEPVISPKSNLAIDHLVELVIADGVITQNEKDTIRRIADEKSLNYDEIMASIDEKIKQNKDNPETELIDQSKKNGNDFENFIVQKFNQKYFKIKEWASDKYVNGLYSETNMNPDIQFEFSLKGETHQFWVECKWRKKLFQNNIEFAKSAQLERYRKYEKEKGIPVFVAIGIGGQGGKPEQLYIVPLTEIQSNVLSLDFLQKFRKDQNDHFFFDPKTQTLR